MINEKLENAFNSQINAEFYSEYFYLAMYAYFDRMNLQGFKNWMNVQMQEEHAHAMGLFNYLQERGGKVVLAEIAQPKNDWANPVEVFEDVLKHEQYVTSRINALADVADEVKDRAAVSFLDWYIKEQVEEESNVSNVLKTIKLVCDDKQCLYMLDKELATRTFTAPVIG
jgi:ferritin